MRLPIANLAVVIVALVATAAPLTTSFADTPAPSPNAINNATVDPAAVPRGSGGIYDPEDQYKDSNGFPLPGWEFLTRPWG